MLKIELNLSELNATQIAMLDAVFGAIPVPSKVKNAIIDAGYANCGEDEYRRLYIAMSAAIASTITALQAKS